MGFPMPDYQQEYGGQIGAGVSCFFCCPIISRWEDAFIRKECAEISQDSETWWLARCLKWNCSDSISDVNFTVTTSAKDGVDISFGTCTIHAPESLSVHHLLIQMVLFTKYHLFRDMFACPKPMVAKSIIATVERSASSASPNVYEDCWVPAKPQRELHRAFEFDPLETVDGSSHPSFSVLADKSTEKVSSTVSSTQRAGRAACRSVTVDHAQMKLMPACVTTTNMDKAPTGADLVDFVTSSGTRMLAPGTSLHQQLVLNNLADEHSDKPRSNSAPSAPSSDETTRVPAAQELTDVKSQQNSDPNSCVVKLDTIEEAKRPGEWFVATGAAHHATGDRNQMTDLEQLENDGLCVHAADGTPMPVRGRGKVVTETVVLPDVYYVPGLWTNLVSVGQLAGLDYCVGFGRGACVVSDAAGTVVGRAHARGDGLYEVDYLIVPLDMPCHDELDHA